MTLLLMMMILSKKTYSSDYVLRSSVSELQKQKFGTICLMKWISAIHYRPNIHKLEDTHRVRTHAVLLLSVKCALT